MLSARKVSDVLCTGTRSERLSFGTFFARQVSASSSASPRLRLLEEAGGDGTVGEANARSASQIESSTSSPPYAKDWPEGDSRQSQSRMGSVASFDVRPLVSPVEADGREVKRSVPFEVHEYTPLECGKVSDVVDTDKVRTSARIEACKSNKR